MSLNIRAAVRFAWPAIAGYLLVRIIGLVVYVAFAEHAHRSVVGMLGNYDGRWYVGVAEHGYDTSITYHNGRLANTNVAFFPLFPWLIRAVAAIGVPPVWAGLLLAAGFGVAAAWGIFLVGARLHSRALGIVLAVLWGVIPHAIVENMVYTETLFTALSAWALWAVLERRWLLAGVLTAIAGLTRPTAVALVAAVGGACLIAAVRRRDGWRPWVAGLLTPVGLVAYWIWCAIALHRVDAWFWMQNVGWRSRFDFGAATARGLWSAATHERPLAVYMTSLVLIIAVALLFLLIKDRQAAWPVIVFAGVVLALVLLQGGDGSGYFHAKGRFLIPAFPLLIPLAVALVGTRRHVRLTVLGLMTLISAWYGSYLSLIWTLSP